MLYVSDKTENIDILILKTCCKPHSLCKKYSNMVKIIKFFEVYVFIKNQCEKK